MSIRHRRRDIGPLAAITGLLLSAAASHGQGAASEVDPSELIDTKEATVDTEASFRSGSFFVAPVPRATPTLGNSIYLLGGYIFQADPGSRTSFIGIGTMFNDNGSELDAIGGRLSLFSRKLQVRFGYGESSLFYDTFLEGQAVPIRQDATGYLLSLGYGVTEDLTIGVAGRYTESLIVADKAALPPDFPTNQIDLETGRVGLFAEYETTDNDVFPREGWRVNVSADVGEIQTGEDFSLATALVDYYLPFGERDTLAMRAALCSSTDDTPYFIECSIGRTDKFRGFEFFRYGGTALASFQAEYRGRFGDRFGYSLYGGVGAAGDGFDGLSDEGAGWQGAAGFGLRYQLTKRFPLDLSFDLTFNSQSETNAYFMLGQGF